VGKQTIQEIEEYKDEVYNLNKKYDTLSNTYDILVKQSEKRSEQINSMNELSMKERMKIQNLQEKLKILQDSRSNEIQLENQLKQ
jgi:hypothetical protein